MIHIPHFQPIDLNAPGISNDAEGYHLLDTCKRYASEIHLIGDIIEQCPSALSFKDDENRMALHMLCANRVTLPVIQLVINSYSVPREACQQATTKGMLPLHYACREQCTPDVILFLMMQYPQAVDCATTTGWTPLHMACARQPIPEVVQLLIRESPASAGKGTQERRLPLHFACANQASLPVVEALVRSCRDALKVQDSNSWTPLHLACSYKQSAEVIRFLVRAWRDGLTIPGKKGRVPLHLACREGQPLSVIRFLVQECDDTIWMRDLDGSLPVHAACQGSADISIIQYLILQSPEMGYEIGNDPYQMAAYAFRRGDLEGNHPSPDEDLVEWFQKHVPSSRSMQAQQQQQQQRNAAVTSQSVPSSRHSETYSSRTSSSRNASDGATLEARRTSEKMEQDTWSAGQRLHRACEAPQALRIIRTIVRDIPTAVEYESYGGLCPIHTACLNQASLEVMQYLCEGHEYSVQRKDNDGNLPIHLACFSGAPLESIQYLLQKWPQSLFTKNKEGELPLDRANHPFLDNPDPQIIALLQAEMSSYHQQEHDESIQRTPSSRENSDPAGDRGIRTTDGPMGVEELREKLNSMRAKKKETKPVDARRQNNRNVSESSGTRSDDSMSPERSSRNNNRLLNAVVSPLHSRGRLDGRQNLPSFPLKPTMVTERSLSVPTSHVHRLSAQPTIVEAGTLLDRPSRPGAMAVQEPAIRPDSVIYRANVSRQPVEATGPSITPERNRLRDAPVVVAAGMLSEQPSRPGAMAVQEPAIRPDSAMYIAAYGNSGSPDGAPLEQEGVDDNGANDGLDTSIRLEAPQLTSESSFYRAALHDSRNYQSEAHIDAALHDSRNYQSEVHTDDQGLPATSESSPAVASVPKSTQSSFYASAMEVAEEEPDGYYDERKPAAVERETEGLRDSFERASLDSSFYRSAIEASEAESNRAAYSMSKSTESSFYRSALDASTNNMEAENRRVALKRQPGRLTTMVEEEQEVSGYGDRNAVLGQSMPLSTSQQFPAALPREQRGRSMGAAEGSTPAPQHQSSFYRAAMEAAMNESET